MTSYYYYDRMALLMAPYSLLLGKLFLLPLILLLLAPKFLHLCLQLLRFTVTLGRKKRGSRGEGEREKKTVEEEGRREHEGTGEEREREMERGGEGWEEEERREKEGGNALPINLDSSLTFLVTSTFFSFS